MADPILPVLTTSDYTHLDRILPKCYARFALMKPKKSYKVIFEPQEEGGYTATVPALPGCVSEGNTYDQALANIQEAIALYLESLQADGLPIPEETHLILEVEVTHEPAAGAHKP